MLLEDQCHVQNLIKFKNHDNSFQPFNRKKSTNKNYIISILKDYSRLEEVYRLTHDTFVESGEIPPQKDGVVVTSKHLDHDSNTIILIAESHGKIIGTISATIDSENGLNVDNWFNKEVNIFRTMGIGKLGSSWRLATVPSYRGRRELIIDLINKAFDVLIDEGCEVCLCALMNKHVKHYQKLMDAKVVTVKRVMFGKDIEMELNLMLIGLHQGRSKFRRII